MENTRRRNIFLAADDRFDHQRVHCGFNRPMLVKCKDRLFGRAVSK
jgi:hypothetical protein